MGLKNDAFPSSAAFDMINDSVTADASEREKAIKQAGAIFAFTIKNEAGNTESWYIDLKNKGEVGKGAAPPGGKADVTLVLSDADFGKLVAGTADAQRLFMGGKLKIRGNMMKATKLQSVMAAARPAKSKL